MKKSVESKTWMEAVLRRDVMKKTACDKEEGGEGVLAWLETVCTRVL